LEIRFPWSQHCYFTYCYFVAITHSVPEILEVFGQPEEDLKNQVLEFAMAYDASDPKWMVSGVLAIQMYLFPTELHVHALS